MRKLLRSASPLLFFLFLSQLLPAQVNVEDSNDLVAAGSMENEFLQTDLKSSNLPEQQKNLRERLIAYPNPSNGAFTVDASGINEMKIAIEILDITGKVVFKNEYPVAGTLSESIDLQHLNRGMYFLRLIEGDSISTLKLMFR